MDINSHIFYKVKTITRPIVFDIGAASGSDSYGMKRLVPQALICSFEPDPRNIRDFRNNYVPSQFREGDPVQNLQDMHFFPVAMGSTVGQQTFYLSGGRPRPDYPTDFSYASSLLKPANHLKVNPWCTFDKQITVPVTTIDAFCQEHNIPRIDFVWADTQGAEHEVLRGAENTLSKIRYIYLECCDASYYETEWSFKQLHEYFVSKGWSLVERYPEDCLFQNDNYQEIAIPNNFQLAEFHPPDRPQIISPKLTERQERRAAFLAERERKRQARRARLGR